MEVYAVEVCRTKDGVGDAHDDGGGDSSGCDSMDIHSPNPNSKGYSSRSTNHIDTHGSNSSMDRSNRSTSYTKVQQIHPTNQTSRLHT